MLKLWLALFTAAACSIATPAAKPWYVDTSGRQITLQLADASRARAARMEAGLPDGGLVFSLPNTSQVAGLDRGVIVKLNTPALAVDARLLRGTGLEHQRSLDASGTMHLLTSAGPRAALAGARALSGRSGVAWAVPDFWVPITWSGLRPTDPFYGLQWHDQQPSGAHLHAEEAWAQTTGDARVVVAVLDTGVERTHPDFDPDRILPGHDFCDEDADPTPESSVHAAHGTLCAGQIAAAMNNGRGGCGLCPGCTLLPIRLPPAGTFLSNYVQAFQFALAQGAWIASNSWVINEDVASIIDLTPLEEAIAELARQGRGGLGAIVLFASGNGDGQDQAWLARPIGQHQLARLPVVVAVGGSGADDRVTGYSNFGPPLSVVAPTGHTDTAQFPGIFTTDTTGPRGVSRQGVFWVDEDGEDRPSRLEEPDPSGDYTAWMSGTSAATANAAGVAALVLSANPLLTAPEVKRILEQTADRVWEKEAAYDEDGHSDRYGHGRLNAGRAVRAAALGLELPQGSVCAEDVNCATGACRHKGAGGGLGVCADAPGRGGCGPGHHGAGPWWWIVAVFVLWLRGRRGGERIDRGEGRVKPDGQTGYDRQRHDREVTCSGRGSSSC